MKSEEMTPSISVYKSLLSEHKAPFLCFLHSITTVLSCSSLATTSTVPHRAHHLSSPQHQIDALTSPQQHHQPLHYPRYPSTSSATHSNAQRCVSYSSVSSFTTTRVSVVSEQSQHQGKKMMKARRSAAGDVTKRCRERGVSTARR